jgi:hypothetical protein
LEFACEAVSQSVNHAFMGIILQLRGFTALQLGAFGGRVEEGPF